MYAWLLFANRYRPLSHTRDFFSPAVMLYFDVCIGTHIVAEQYLTNREQWFQLLCPPNLPDCFLLKSFISLRLSFAAFEYRKLTLDLLQVLKYLSKCSTMRKYMLIRYQTWIIVLIANNREAMQDIMGHLENFWRWKSLSY